MTEQVQIGADSPLARIQARVREKDFAGALTLVSKHLEDETADRAELLYMQAVCQRYLARQRRYSNSLNACSNCRRRCLPSPIWLRREG